MKPLTAHLERFQKQPPLIKEEEDTAEVKKRPFSNCVLFVLLAVFVFFLACLAVYTAVAMGIPVEKNEAAPTKSELSASKAQFLPDSMIDKTPHDEPNKNDTTKTGNDSVIVSNPTRLRIQIFIKGKESEGSKELSDLDQNKTEDIFNSPPKGIFLRRIIIHNNGINKPEIDSSEEVSSGSDESVKDIFGFKPFGISNAPNPLDLFFNLLKLTEGPLDNIFNMLEKQKNKTSNSSAVEFLEKSIKNDTAINPKDQVEKFTTVAKQTNEQKSNQSEQSGKPNEKTFEKQEISHEDELFNPFSFVNDAQRMISSIEQKQHDNDNVTPHAVRTPVIRFFRFISPDHSQVQNSYSPMYQRTFYQHPNTYSNGMTRFPYNQEHMTNKGSFRGEHDKMDEVKYNAHTTMVPTTMHQTRTTSHPQVYSTTPNGYSTPMNKNMYRGSFGETTNHHDQKLQNQMMTSLNKQEQPGMIDRIDTENIKPFEDFFKFKNL